MPNSLLTPAQAEMDLSVQQEREIDGIGMGVLSDGTPYLTGRGLAQLCGVDQKAIVQVTTALSSGIIRPREAKIADLLERHGADKVKPYVEVEHNGSRYYAFPASACMAFLEYYAFEAGTNLRKEALDAFRRLAGKGLRDYIYTNLGYNPNAVPLVWKKYHDRITSTFGDIPSGYFTVFKEAADLIVTLIRNGADVGPHFVPDGSIGSHWAKYWRESNLEEKFGRV